MKKNQKSFTTQTGEIITLITIGTLLFVGFISFISTTVLKQTQIAKTNAAVLYGISCTKCDGPGGKCAYHPELDKRTNPTNPGCDDNGCTKDGSNGVQCPADKTTGTTTGSTTPVPTINCSPGKFDIAGKCNPACCSINSDCLANGPNQVCGVQNGYCKSGLSCAAIAPSQTKPLYARICGGASNGTCGWQFCNGTTIHDPVRNIDIPCQTDQNTAPAPMCQGDSECAAQVTNNTCFYLTDEIYYDKGQGFSHNVKFWSPSGGGDGHIALDRNGGNTGLLQTPWNRGVYNPFVVPPGYTGGYSNKTETVTFTGTADHCKQGIGSASISCTTGVNPDGSVFVRGAGCEGKNFTNTAPTSSATTNSGTPTNRCPNATVAGVSCKPSCGNGEKELQDRPCINFWDKCCAPDTSATVQKFPTINQVQVEKDIEVDVAKDAIPAFLQTHIAISICDYFGTTNFGRDDIRNCQGVPYTENNGKIQMKLKIKQNQKQLMCYMATPVIEIPGYCVPVN